MFGGFGVELVYYGKPNNKPTRKEKSKLETKEKQSIGNKTAMALMKKRLFDTKIQTKPITLAEIDKLIALEKTQIIAAFGAGDLGLVDAETYYKLYE